MKTISTIKLNEFEREKRLDKKQGSSSAQAYL